MNILEWIDACERAHANAVREGRKDDAAVLHDIWHRALTYVAVREADLLHVPEEDREAEAVDFARDFIAEDQSNVSSDVEVEIVEYLDHEEGL